jgi:hypothetical protein
VIYKGGFTDVPHPFDKLLAIFAVIIVEGAFIWLVFGYTRTFSSGIERTICLIGMTCLLATMLLNLVTHFMIVKGIGLDPFQQTWCNWGAVLVFIFVLVMVLVITLVNPSVRLMRLELRYDGKQQETIWGAKLAGLDSEKIKSAMEQRAGFEADRLADQIIGESRRLPPSPIEGFARDGEKRKSGVLD